MRLLPIIDHMQQNCPSLNDVAPAPSLSPFLDDDSATLPAAFLHPWEEQSSQSPTVMCITQEDSDRFGIMIVADAINFVTNPDGSVDLGSSSEALEDIREEIRDVLSGKEFGQHGPLERVGGSVIDQTNKVIWWREVYRATRHFSEDV